MTIIIRFIMLVTIGAWLTVLLISALFAQDHQHVHPTEIITGETGKFYERWDRIDAPGVSCCNRMDCYTAPARQVGGAWFFLRREDQRWTRVPADKIETRYDSPDGRSHVCASSPAVNAVYCFLPAGGT